MLAGYSINTMSVENNLQTLKSFFSKYINKCLSISVSSWLFNVVSIYMLLGHILIWQINSQNTAPFLFSLVNKTIFIDCYAEYAYYALYPILNILWGFCRSGLALFKLKWQLCLFSKWFFDYFWYLFAIQMYEFISLK